MISSAPPRETRSLVTIIIYRYPAVSMLPRVSDGEIGRVGGRSGEGGGGGGGTGGEGGGGGRGKATREEAIGGLKQRK